MKEENTLEKILRMIFMVGTLSLIVMLIWNWLIPSIFNIRQISYIESVGLWLLCDILFKAEIKE